MTAIEIDAMGTGEPLPGVSLRIEEMTPICCEECTSNVATKEIWVDLIELGSAHVLSLVCDECAAETADHLKNLNQGETNKQ